MSHPPTYLLKVFLGVTIVGVVLFAVVAGARPDGEGAVLGNPDFEKGKIGGAPAGWIVPGEGTPYAAEITGDNPMKGKQCALLYSRVGARPTPDEFGNMLQHIDARRYRGRIVRFRAAVRVEGSDTGMPARAQLWFRVDLPGKESVFFANMERAPIEAGEWRYYEISGEVDREAELINVGIFMTGRGKTWIDDASLEILDLPPFPAESPRKLSERGMENVLAFARLVGYVRYFHPSDQAAATNWDAFAIRGVREVEGAGNAEELVKRLRVLFSPIAPTVRIMATDTSPLLLPELTEPRKRGEEVEVIRWNHIGLGIIKSEYTPYRSERLRAPLRNELPPPGWADPGESLIYDLDGGVSCAIPLTLFTDEKGTIPHLALPAAANPDDALRYTGDDRATRLAGVVIAWNIFQHFYPYFDVIDLDWPTVLRETLASAATDAGRREFTKTLERMIAKLHDGHGSVAHRSLRKSYSIPLLWDWVEGRLVVTHVGPGANQGIRPGDEVMLIDGKSASDAMAEAESRVSAATDDARRHRAAQALRFGAKDSDVGIKVGRDSAWARLMGLRRTEYGDIAEPRPGNIEEIRPAIYYIDLERIDDSDFARVLPDLRKARAIIFDVRGYPRVSPDLLAHFIDRPVRSPIWMIPIVTIPDHNFDNYDTSGRWTIEPKEPRLTAKAIFLTDSRAISYAESFMGIVEHYKLGEIIGEPTAGTNGNVNTFTLPGGYQIRWTGMRVLKPDGSRHHGVGIVPTIPVWRSIEAIKAQRDEQLERAVVVGEGKGGVGE